MYKVETDKGIYAVKELNSGVMKREKAYSNFVFSEKVTDIAKENGISAIGALKFNDDIMIKIDDSYFMVFEWNRYIPLAEEHNKPYIKEFKENIELLYELNKNSVEALEYAKNNLVISHTDLDRKNVMWQDEKSTISYLGFLNDEII